MARYNTSSKTITPTVKNFEGGDSYKLNPKHELISLMVSGFDNTFYEKLSDREIRFSDLIKDLAKKDPEFVAKTLIYTRSVVGQRSVTHFGSTVLAPYLSGTELGKRFYSKRDRKSQKGGIIHRLDDMLEIVACYLAMNPNKPLPNAMKKGFKSALESADTYELAKYQGKGKSVSMVDIVNLVHPKPSSEMVETFKKLMTGELKQFNTVEDKNTESGKIISQKLKSGELTKEQAEVELKEAKEDNFKELIEKKTIGYLALLRNLRNILKTSSNDDLIGNTCRLLTDEKFIKKSLVFPHQIDLALEVLLGEFSSSSMEVRKILSALNTAYELSIPNLTELFAHGKTAVVFDTSGSMSSSIKLEGGKQGRASALDKAALIAATLVKGINADAYQFADRCLEVSYNPLDSVNTIKSGFLSQKGRAGGGTNFNSIFNTIGSNYDRVFVISDEQGASVLEKSAYKNMHVYSINLCGYGTTMFKPGKNVHSIFGYGSDIYELVKKVEIDPNAIMSEIEKIVI